MSYSITLNKNSTKTIIPNNLRNQQVYKGNKGRKKGTFSHDLKNFTN